MYILATNMWFQKLMKQFFFGIDQVVYNMISTIYDLLISIARTSVLTQADILDMADRIYKLLAIFMVFKVIISLITYIVNPDDFSDKTKGVSKLATNIVISLALLILTPYIFNYAYRLQTIILEDNSLATLIFGEKEGVTANQSFLNSAGDDMAYITMSAFFTPNTSINEFQNCIELTFIDEDGNTRFNPACSGLDDSYEKLQTNNSLGVDVTTTMAGVVDNDKESTLTLQDLQNYVVGVENKNLGLMFRQDLAIATANGNIDFAMDYKYIFSTVVGVVVILLLITFCMDVAVRSIKLAFLQLIAPIPILSYIDPKSGKDGMFKKWYQLCFKTFLSLFIRLLALYFAIYIISRVADMKLVDIIDGSYQTNAWIYIFVIIGALMFAKDFPKILEGLGIKLDGDGKFFINPIKKMEESAALGKNITGLARGALAGTAGALSGAGLGRGISGAWRGMTAGKGWSETGKAENEMNKKMRQARLDGSTFGGRLGAKFANATGFISETERIAREKHGIQQNIDAAEARKKAIEADITPARRIISNSEATSAAITAMQERSVKKIQEGDGAQGAHYQALLRDAEGYRQAGNGAMAVALEQEAEKYLHGDGMKSWMNDKIQNGGDQKFGDLYDEYKSKAGISGDTVATTAEALDSQSKDIGTRVSQTKVEIAGREQEILRYDDELKGYNSQMQDISERERRAKADESVI